MGKKNKKKRRAQKRLEMLEMAFGSLHLAVRDHMTRLEVRLDRMNSNVDQLVEQTDGLRRYAEDHKRKLDRVIALIEEVISKASAIRRIQTAQGERMAAMPKTKRAKKSKGGSNETGDA